MPMAFRHSISVVISDCWLSRVSSSIRFMGYVLPMEFIQALPLQEILLMSFLAILGGSVIPTTDRYQANAYLFDCSPGRLYTSA